MANVGLLTAAAQSVLAEGTTAQLQVLAIVWEGSTSAGDTVTLSEVNTNNVVWRGRASGTNTYQGIQFGNGVEALRCEGGIQVDSISSGTVFVYTRDK